MNRKTTADEWAAFAKACRNLWDTSPLAVMLIVSAVIALLVAFL